MTCVWCMVRLEAWTMRCCGVVTVFLLALLLLNVPRSLAANECSFVRSYQNQQCVYNIHLSQNSGTACDKSSARSRRHFRRHLGQEPQRQNDYADKVDVMQKDFSFMRDQHEKRLKDLEGTVKELLGMDVSSPHSVVSSLVKSSVELGAGRVSQAGADSNVLTQLHEEFGKLRKALRDQSAQLLDVQLRSNETVKLFEKSQVDLFGVNQDLLNAEHKIAVLERERAVLKNQLKDRNYRLGASSGRASECEGKLKEQEEQLLRLIRSENRLTEDKMTCQLLLNTSRQEQAGLERRHQQLKTRHSRTKRVLKIRENELIDCYAAKTDTFCGFEDSSLCGFTQPNDTSDFFDWNWGEGATPSRHTGPTADHTCGTQQGHFMFIEASAKGRGKNAIIYSPLYRGLQQQCLQFFYHMHGKHIGTLNVYAKARGAELASVWRAWGNQGDIWTVARLAIPKQLARAGYQIAFEGITENGYQGDMAIDDISVRDGECGEGEGIQTVVVKFNASSIHEEEEEVEDFARILRRQRMARIAFRGFKRSRP